MPDSPGVFTKTYSDAAAARRAAAHRRWLSVLGAPVPDLIETTGHHLRLCKIHSEHAGLDDLEAVAALLGELHWRAHRTEFREARLNHDHRATECVLPNFTATRRQRVRDLLATDNPLGTLLTAKRADDLFDHASRLPAAFYKDTNIRNVLVTTEGPVLIDFDDLTLAPFGYDLAKLLLSAAMTYGTPALERFDQSLEAYKAAGGLCSRNDLMVWIEINFVLTATYVGNHGYRHAWPDIRPTQCLTVPGMPESPRGVSRATGHPDDLDSAVKVIGDGAP